jgi:hypothetical protein
MARWIVAVLVWLALAGVPAQAGLKRVATEKPLQRLALVIGVTDYGYLSDLKNAVSDARLVRNALEKVGFEVTLLADADAAEIETAVRAHAQRIAEAGGAISAFYYAGQGFEIDRASYIAAADARIESLADVDRAATSFDAIVAEIEAANAEGINLFLFDACRDNPFHSATTTRGRWPSSKARGRRPASGEASSPMPSARAASPRTAGTRMAPSPPPSRARWRCPVSTSRRGSARCATPPSTPPRDARCRPPPTT